MQYATYWGDMHAQFNLTRMRGEIQAADPGLDPVTVRDRCQAALRQSFDSAREYLDFFPIVYYPAYYERTLQGLAAETVGMRSFRPWRRSTRYTARRKDAILPFP